MVTLLAHALHMKSTGVLHCLTHRIAHILRTWHFHAWRTPWNIMEDYGTLY